MMSHIGEERISAYIDGQLDAEDNLEIEVHLRDCSGCRAVCDEMRDVTRLFREAESLEPSPYLWNRIEACLDTARPSALGWGFSIASRLRSYGWSPTFAVAAFALFLVVALALFHGSSGHISERAALAEIDRTYRSLAAQDPEVYNPFSSGSQIDLEANPFRSLRLSGTVKKSAPAASQH
jgi:anti-sigma factor RsiW